MKAAHRHRNTGPSKWPRNIQSARILIGLDAHQSDQSKIVILPEVLKERRNIDPGVGLIDHCHIDVDIRPQHLALGAIDGNTIDGRKRVGRYHRPPPANDISVIIVMRWFDEDEPENTPRGRFGAE